MYLLHESQVVSCTLGAIDFMKQLNPLKNVKIYYHIFYKLCYSSARLISADRRAEDVC